MKKIFIGVFLIISILMISSCRIKTSEPTIPSVTPEVSETIPSDEPTVDNPVEDEPTIVPTNEPVTETETVTPVSTDVKIIEAKGYMEGAYVSFEHLDEVNDFNVYYKSSNENDFNKLDKMLIRKYNNYYRADILGLKKGSYQIKVISVVDNVEVGEPAISNVDVISHTREGFSFKGESSGAYNNDGTLKENAQVIYVTKNNAKTVTATVNGVVCTGFQTILDAKQKKNTSNDILCFRIIGCIELKDLDHISSSSEGLQVKGSNEYTNMNITIEGVGNDAYFNGFGMLIRNCSNVEVRNLGFINFMDDGISIDTNNSNLWIHNNDFYYGSPGGDSDQAKGDGSLDIKKSKFITISYNHFWDSGKCCLLDASTGEGSDYITYHHNWFDHADSRMPRVRNANVHVYNNYYDGISKYGIGAAGGGSSIFSEANYFYNTLHPYLSSKQGTDALGEGTFSGEDGGIIKSFNDYNSNDNYITYEDNNTSFDVYIAKTKEEVLPNTIVSLSGGYSYTNFDTSDVMYEYTADTADIAKENVIKYSGRLNGGDINFEFKEEHNSSYEIITELKQLIINYESKLIKSLGDTINSESTTPITPEVPSNPTISDNISHNFTESGLESEVFVITGNLSTSKGSVEFNDLTLTKCLKIESSTTINFTIDNKMVLTLVFGGSTSAVGKSIKIDGEKNTIDSNNMLIISLEAGTHTITKGDSINLFYILLSLNE